MLQNLQMIHQQNIEIQFDDFSDGLAIQNEIRDLFYEKLLPRMQYLFDEIGDKNYTISMDRLEVDCGLLSAKHWKEELVEETLRLLRQELIIYRKTEIKNMEIDGGEIEVPGSLQSFLFFLQKGYLPWNSRIQSMKELENATSENLNSAPIFTKKIRTLFGKNPSAIDRLLHSFSRTFLQNLLEQLTENKSERVREIYLFLDNQRLSDSEKHIGHILLFKILSSGPVDVEQFYSSFEAEIKNAEIKKQSGKIINLKKKDAGIESIYIENAGLVLLHPFLPELFKTLGLWKDEQWKDNSSQHIAVQTLEYLVSGREDFPEFNLPLNKILCGMDVSEVLQPVEELPSTIKTECEHLLEEVIRHWRILKNTSVEGLRETFLQRNGKISSVDKGWLINVEQKGVDVLLSHLPWGVGVVKLPWTADVIFVEWI